MSMAESEPSDAHAGTPTAPVALAIEATAVATDAAVGVGGREGDEAGPAGSPTTLSAPGTASICAATGVADSEVAAAAPPAPAAVAQTHVPPPSTVDAVVAAVAAAAPVPPPLPPGGGGGGAGGCGGGRGGGGGGGGGGGEGAAMDPPALPAAVFVNIRKHTGHLLCVANVLTGPSRTGRESCLHARIGWVAKYPLQFALTQVRIAYPGRPDRRALSAVLCKAHCV
jgi:hypothetical protein